MGLFMTGLCAKAVSNDDLKYRVDLQLQNGKSTKVGEAGSFFAIGENYYVLHRDAMLVKRFDKDGLFVNEFDIKGVEEAFGVAGAILAYGNDIGVVDLQKASLAIYSPNGTYKRTIQFSGNEQLPKVNINISVPHTHFVNSKYLILPVYSETSVASRDYFHEGNLIGLFDKNGKLLFSFGDFPSFYKGDDVYYGQRLCYFHVDELAKEIYVSFEATSVIQVYNFEGTITKTFGSEIGEDVFRIPLSEENNLYYDLRNRSYINYEIFKSTLNGKFYRLVLKPNDANTKQREVELYLREKVLQVYDSNYRLSKELVVPYEIIGIIGENGNAKLSLLGFNKTLGTYFLANSDI